REGLGGAERTGRDVVESIAWRHLSSIRWRTDRLAAVTHLFGPAQLLVTLGNIQRADTPERIDRYLDRLAAVPTFLAGVQDQANRGADDGITAPALVVDRTLAQVERLLRIEPQDSPGM